MKTNANPLKKMTNKTMGFLVFLHCLKPWFKSMVWTSWFKPVNPGYESADKNESSWKFPQGEGGRKVSSGEFELNFGMTLDILGIHLLVKVHTNKTETVAATLLQEWTLPHPLGSGLL